MNEKDKETIMERLSKINELRHKYWAELRAARNSFFAEYPGKEWKDDLDWQEIRFFFHDLFQSTILEEARRETGLKPARIKGRPHQQAAPSGIFLSDRLCMVCSLPLKGKQEKFCSQRCRSIAKSRTWRREHPELKELSNYKYLKSIKKHLPKSP